MSGKIRIIAGEWRGRKLEVPDKQGLRPTPNRLRETLFNWLAMYLPGSRCLDLFAGSGALGIEAASRGAKEVLLIEKDYDIVQVLKQQLLSFKAYNKINILHTDAIHFLKSSPRAFDIIFLDPPFGQYLLNPSCHLLEESGWLSSQALIYLETESNLRELSLPTGWQIIRQKKAGQVTVFLAKRLN
jgi:16S rRNA (guanine966-N2)-methyltransferase